jgi:ABC-type transporter Mla subunit MlaD
MISSTLHNLIVSIVAVGILVVVLRVAYLAAGGRLEETPAKAQVDTSYDLERAA